LIYLGSLASPDRLQKVHPWKFPLSDKVDHFVAYLVLSLLLVRGWQREKMPPLELHAIVWLLCVVYSFMLEVLQGMSGDRSFDLTDLAANAIGAFFGLALWHAVMLKYGKRTRLYPGLLRPDFKDHPSNRKRS
jgi:VanZ family protein